MAYDSIEPMGEERMDQRFRIITAWIVNAVRFGGDPLHPNEVKFYDSEEPTGRDEPLAAVAEVTEVDVLRDLAEQAQFR